VAGKGHQTISFDLPEHGDRKSQAAKCTVQNAVEDLSLIANLANQQWTSLSLFGSSLGAYFSLVAYQGLHFEKCLFLSPILDMENLIRKMMDRSNVSEAFLQEKQEITTPAGELLSWSYYSFVKEHPILEWKNPTCILYGSRDDLTPASIVDNFVAAFHCHLDVVQNGDHYFHTDEQLEAVDKWILLNS
jgi:uncharacterized protein